MCYVNVIKTETGKSYIQKLIILILEKSGIECRAVGYSSGRPYYDGPISKMSNINIFTSGDGWWYGKLKSAESIFFPFSETRARNLYEFLDQPCTVDDRQLFDIFSNIHNIRRCIV